MTQPYAEVIGDPIAHSKSPVIHRFWLGHCKIDGDYKATRVAPADLEHFIGERRNTEGWRGCNVTIPHKIVIMDHVADLGDVRASIGAMNTVVRNPDGTIFGTNTDAAGFYAPLADVALDGASAVVLGTGGAAHAVLFALSKAGAADVTIVARSPLKGAGLLARFGLKGRVLPMTAALPSVDLVVNATSLGMVGQPPLSLDLTPLPETAIVYDLVYAPLETALLQAAARRGLATIDGLDMLIGQAAVAFELFFGTPAPRESDAELRLTLTS